MLVSLLFYLSSHASASTIATPPGQNATFSHGTQNAVHLTGVGLVTANFTELEALKGIKTRTLVGTRSPDNERNHHMIQLLYPLSQNVKWNTLLDDWWHHFFHIDGLTPIPDIEQCSKLPWSVGHGEKKQLHIWYGNMTTFHVLSICSMGITAKLYCKYWHTYIHKYQCIYITIYIYKIHVCVHWHHISLTISNPWYEVKTLDILYLRSGKSSRSSFSDAPAGLLASTGCKCVTKPWAWKASDAHAWEKYRWRNVKIYPPVAGGPPLPPVYFRA